MGELIMEIQVKTYTQFDRQALENKNVYTSWDRPSGNNTINIYKWIYFLEN